MQQNDFYTLALSLITGIGPKTGKGLIKIFGSAEQVFKTSLKDLARVEGISKEKAKAIKDEAVLKRAEQEMEVTAKHRIQVLSITNPTYPQRFVNCIDSPLILYYRGTANLNAEKIVAIVGTRKSTDYGSRLTEDLVNGLKHIKDLVIISGLAAGIDTIAHKRSLEAGVPTVGVLGTGLDTIYPVGNRELAKQMLGQGGLLTEFPYKSTADKGNFPARNRVVAGISDITVVVESDVKGGALITARIANSYNRDVAAFPGRVTDTRSGGCNQLIRTNVANMITSADDLLELMNWGKGKKTKPMQKELFLDLSPEEQKIITLLQQKDSVHADEIFHSIGMNSSQLAAILLQMEMQGLIKSLPGKLYRTN